MNKLLRRVTGIGHNVTTRIVAKRGHWALAAMTAATVTSSHAAGAAAIIVNPATLPDLTVSMAAPATTPAYQIASLTVTVSNLPPTTGIWRAGTGNNVLAHVDLTGMTAVHAEGDSGMNCQFSTHNAATPWSTVDCTGTLAWGATATLTIFFQPATDATSPVNACSSTYYCGQPAYADASVSYLSGGSERSSANDRALSRVDMVDCIN